MKRGWFGPKRIGWGASPARREGWAVTGVFVLVMGLTGALFSEQSWFWVPMLVNIAIYLVVIVLTYDNHARTHV